MMLPYEIWKSIFADLSRGDLWALSLTDRQCHELVTPTLYQTVAIGLRGGIALSKKFIRSLALSPQHSKVHLIQNVIIIPGERNSSGSDYGWRDSGVAMINEILYAFLRKLGDGQLRRFIWRSGLNISTDILLYLAEHQGRGLECLYIDTDLTIEAPEKELSLFSNFSTLRTLQWNGCEAKGYAETLIMMLKASASSLEVLRITYLNSSGSFRSVDGILRNHAGGMKLSALAECEIGMHGQNTVSFLVLDSLRQSSRIRRIRASDSLEALAEHLSKFTGLVELDIHLSGGLRFKDAIFRHGETLRVLSLSSSDLFEKSGKCITDEELREIGYGCPNLVELGMTQDFSDGARVVPFTKVPLHIFRKLELIFIMMESRHNIGYVHLYHEILAGKNVIMELEAMLDNQPSSSDIPSGNLKIVAMGMRRIIREIIHSKGQVQFWKVIHPSVANGKKSVTMKRVSAETSREMNPGWTLVRRDLPLIQNEELDRLCRCGPHLPPSSELIDPSGSPDRWGGNYESKSDDDSEDDEDDEGYRRRRTRPINPFLDYNAELDLEDSPEDNALFSSEDYLEDDPKDGSKIDPTE